MKATIYFLYKGTDGWDSRDTTVADAEKDIRYWLGKSPGIYELEDILVVPESVKGDWMKIPAKMRDEETEYARTKAIEAEKTELQRLKAKYESKL
jgi:hypothetical protein